MRIADSSELETEVEGRMHRRGSSCSSPAVSRAVCAVRRAATLGVGGFLLMGCAAAASAQTCPGDCDADTVVSKVEVIAAVVLALDDAGDLECPGLDRGDGLVTVDDVVAAVAVSLGPCSPRAALAGVCLTTAPEGLVSCDAGTEVRVVRCDDPARCLGDPSATTLLGTALTDQAGQFSVTFRSRLGGVAPLIVEAHLDGDAVFRTIAYARVAVAANPASELQIGPTSEAAIRLMADSGFENFSEDEVIALITAVEAANADTDFSGLDPEQASTRAQQTAANDPNVLQIIERSLATPTATATSSPTRTSSPSATLTAPPTATRATTATRTPTPSRPPASTPTPPSSVCDLCCQYFREQDCLGSCDPCDSNLDGMVTLIDLAALGCSCEAPAPTPTRAVTGTRTPPPMRTPTSTPSPPGSACGLCCQYFFGERNCPGSCDPCDPNQDGMVTLTDLFMLGCSCMQ